MDRSEPFLYTGQPRGAIPRSITHVRVDPSVLEIDAYAFKNCRQLIRVVLCEGLERIYNNAFENCTSLQQIIIPTNVAEIGSRAFQNCSQLMNVDLNEWLEFIDDRAFCRCTSLEQIIIPPNVENLGVSVFSGCRQLMSIQLSEGLEKIPENSFQGCSALRSIRIPSTVIFIAEDAFKNSSGLLEIEFCEVLEQFVHEVPLTWWNHGNSAVSLRTYSFLAKKNILARLDRIKKRSWKIHIHDMLQRIPEELITRPDDYMDSIDSQLSKYEQAKEVAFILELHLWKELMEGKSRSNLMKLQWRYNSLSMVPIIIPNVLLFL